MRNTFSAYTFPLVKLVFFAAIVCPQKGSSQGLDAMYHGKWGDRQTDYLFRPDGTFVFNSKSSFKSAWSKGRYDLCGDSLVLNSYPQDVTTFEEYILYEEYVFLVDNPDCIISVSDGYDYCRTYRICKEGKGGAIICEYLESRQRLN